MKQQFEKYWGIWEGDLFTNFRACAGEIGVLGRPLQEQNCWQVSFLSPTSQPRYMDTFKHQHTLPNLVTVHPALCSVDTAPPKHLGHSTPKVVPQVWQCASSSKRYEHHNKVTLALNCPRWLQPGPLTAQGSNLAYNRKGEPLQMTGLEAKVAPPQQ